MRQLDSRRGAAELAVLRIVEAAQGQPGPRGGLTALQIAALQEALADYITERYPGCFGVDERQYLAREVVIDHQASHHARDAAIDVRAMDDPLGNILLKLTSDRALDFLAARQAGVAPDVVGAELVLGATRRWHTVAEDNELVRSIFGEATAADVRRGLCELYEAGLKTDFRVVQCFLDLAQELGGGPSDREVAELVGVDVRTVRGICLRFANRLGRAA